MTAFINLKLELPLSLWGKIRRWRHDHEFGYHFILATVIVIVHQLLLSFAL